MREIDFEDLPRFFATGAGCRFGEDCQVVYAMLPMVCSSSKEAPRGSGELRSLLLSLRMAGDRNIVRTEMVRAVEIGLECWGRLSKNPHHQFHES